MWKSYITGLLRRQHQKSNDIYTSHMMHKPHLIQAIYLEHLYKCNKALGNISKHKSMSSVSLAKQI